MSGQEHNVAQPLEEVSVTGSRIRQLDDFKAPIPVSSLEAGDLLRGAPTDLAAALRQQPVFVNSLSNNTGVNVDFTQQRGGNFLNMRSLGPERMLILLDGRRVPPTNASGFVDVNTLPQMLVKRVDVVRAGVSAVYGADAVSGVVNYILDNDFEGIKTYAEGGQASRGDNENYGFGLAAGKAFLGERLHLLFSAEHKSSDGIDPKSERPLHAGQHFLTGAGTAANPYRTVSNARQANVTYGGYIGSGPFAGQMFLDANTLAPYDPGVSLGRGYQVGGSGVDWADGTLIDALETTSAFARASFEFTPGLTGFLQAAYGESQTEANTYLDFNFGGMRIFSGNPFLPSDMQAVMTATGTPSFVMSRIHRDFGYMRNDFTNETVNVTAGINGTLARKWQWNAYFTHGSTEMDGKVHNQTRPVNFAAALDAVRDPAGNIVCNVTLTNPGRFDDCVPLNIFGEGTPSAAAKAFVTDTTQYLLENDLDEVGVDINGSPFSSWAGPVQAALGASHREMSVRQTGNSDPLNRVDATGIRGVFSDLPFNGGNFGSADGSVEVDEVFAEISVPIVAGKPMAETLDINGAVRYVDHSTFGGKTVWKAGLVYQPVQDLQLRFTRSADIRAPTLFDLFAGRQQIINPVNDPLTGITQITAQVGGGNPNLLPEEADTISLGLGYRPSWAPGLMVSADYYDIEITDAINQITGQVIVDVCHASGYTDRLCDLVTRPFPPSNTTPANFPTAIASLTNINIGFIQAKGFDIESSFTFEPRVIPGTVTLGGSASYVSSFDINNGTGSPTFEFVGVYGGGLSAKGTGGMPKWRANLRLTYENGPLTLFFQERYIDALDRIGGTQPNAVYADGSNSIPSVFYTDATVEYQFQSYDTKVFATVNNLLDKDAPLIAGESFPNLTYPAGGSVHDLIGRYFTLGVRMRF